MKIVKFDTRRFNHKIGYCLTNNESNYGYIPIPKNASSYVKQYFRIAWNFSDEFNYKTTNRKFIVCLRDPVERWTSGIAEHFHNLNNTIDLDNENMLKYIFSRIVFDEHTEPQVNFLNNLDTDNLIVFNVDSNLTKKLDDFYTNEFNIKNWRWNKDFNLTREFNNISNNVPNKSKIIKLLKSKLIEDNNLKKIRNFYFQDYKLLENVKFI